MENCAPASSTPLKINGSPTRSAPKTPIDRGRRPPRLVLPNPNSNQPINTANTPYTPYTGSVISKASSPYLYPRKQSEFVMGLKGFAKSGLSMGEKSTLWIYNKISALSKKWFTHCFLSIVLAIFTVGGALLFVAVEGKEEDIILEDIRKTRYSLIYDLNNLSKYYPQAASEGEWEGTAVRKVQEYEAFIIQAYKNKSLLVINRGPKVWTFFNAIVYCGTIYTTIAPENTETKNVDKSVEETISTSKLEAMITPEQVLSASVARKRRSLSKKINRAREQTPGRDAVLETSTDEEIPEARPKTPERPRRKSSKNLSASIERSESLKLPKSNVANEHKNSITPSETTLISRNNSIPKQTAVKKRDSLVNITQNEVIALFNKAKRSLASGRERARHKNTEKPTAARSLSVPSQFSEKDLIESLKKANLLDVYGNPQRKPSYQNISNVSSELSDAEEKPKAYRPVVQQYVAKRKAHKQSSAKVIEILNPKTSKVIGKITKGVKVQQSIGIFGFLTIFKYLTIRDMYKVYKIYKQQNQREYIKIIRLRNKCITELMLIMIYCGLGGIMFKYVEGAFENFYKCGVKRVKRDFIDILWHRSHNLREDEWKSLARNKLRSFEEELHSAHEAGMHSYSGQRSWSFLNGVVYCLTVITTIGYGHMFPTTVTGMALTVVYSIVGIPLFLIALTDFGKLFTRGIKFVWSFVRRLYYTGSCRKVRKNAHVEDILQGAHIMYEIATLRRPSIFTGGNANVEDPENPKSPDGTINSTTPTTPAPSNFEIDDEFNLPISLAIFILVIYIFLGALMYCFLENWSFLGSFYFVFISMSTIGFGDYVPSHPVSMIASVVYLVFGLALMSMCINVVQAKLSDTFKDASHKLGATIGLNVNEDDGSINTVSPSLIEVPSVHSGDDKPDANIKKEIKSSLKVKIDDEGKNKDKESEDTKSKPPKEVKF